MGTRGVLTVLVLAASVARAQEPAHDARHTIAERHVSLAERLEKKHPREAFFERLLAIEMDPNDLEARTKLGYKKDENKVWQGAPQLPGASAGAIDPKLLAEIDHVRKDSATKLAHLAKHCVEDKKPDDARVLAGLALEENPEEKIARDVLGMVKLGESWVTAREQKIRAAFAKALQDAKGGEAKAGKDDAALTKECGLGALERKESDHSAVYWTHDAEAVEADGLLRVAEATWLAHRYFLAGDDAGFSVDGEPKRAATGAAAPPPWKPCWLVVAHAEHEKFIESSVADTKVHAFAKNLTGWSEWKHYPSGPLLLNEGHFVPTVRPEWVSAGMTDYLTRTPLERRAGLVPDFLGEGLKRFFSGHAALRAEIFYANAGSSTSKRTFQAGTFDTLRSHARPALEEAPEGTLRELLSKKTNDLDQLDSAVALAFVDYLLAEKRAELASFFAGLSDKEPPLATLEAVMKKSVDDLERDLRAFVRAEY